MTWNIALASRSPKKAKDAIKSNARLPAVVQDAICGALDKIEDGKTVFIESTGHLDANGGNAKFNIRTQQVEISD